MKTIPTYQQALEEVQDYAILQLDVEGTILSWNKGAERIKGYRSEEIVGKNFRVFYNTTDRGNFLPEMLLKRANKEGRICHEGWRVKKDGSMFWGSVVITAIHENDEVTGYLKITKDLTEARQSAEDRKELEKVLALTKALRESEVRFSRIVHATNDAVWEWNLRTGYVWWNEGMQKLFGYRKEDINNSVGWWKSHLHPEDFNRVTTKLENFIESDEEIWSDEYRYLRADGSYAWVFDRGRMERDTEGKPLLMVGGMEDVTRRRKAELDLKIERDWQRILIDNLPDLIFLKDKESRFVIANQATATFMGLKSPSELIGHTDFDFYPKDQAAAFFSNEQEIMKTGLEIVQKEKEQKDSSGNLRWLSTVKTALRDDQGQVIGLVGIEKDITKKKEAEEKQALLATIISATEDAIISKDLNGIVTSWNRGAELLFGFKAEEVIGRHISYHFPNYDADAENETMRKIKEGQHIEYETKRPRKDGTFVHIWTSLSPLRNEDGVIIGASKIARNITEQKKAEESIREAEKRYRTTLDSMIEGCQIIDFQWRYSYINPVAATQGRMLPAQLIGKTMMECFPGIQDTIMFSVLKHCMETRTTEKMENHFIYPDGSHGWFELHIQPSAEGLFILSLDITERKKSEEELLNLTHQITELNINLEQKVADRTQQLVATNKELEAFSYSVSHDLRAPLRAINGYANMLKEDFDAVLNDEGKRILGTIQKNALVMGNLIDDLLDFSRLGRKDLQKSNINMAAMATGVVSELAKSGNSRAIVKVDIQSAAYADRTLIKQVWINLISNAIKYSSKKDQPIIEIRSYHENGGVIYSIKDNGTGFDMTYVNKLFGVFQRLHSSSEFEGTGVGLAIVKRIIEKHGGFIRAESEPGIGATFYFSLPARNTEKEA